MKITLISFDYWNYDQHIVKALQKKGIEATHIDISKFKYKYRSVFEKLKNFVLKTFFNKNIKKIKRLEYITNTLESLGKQDAILVIRPDLIPLAVHTKIKTFTNQYIAYIYDSCVRFPVDHLLNGVFDSIYSFDLKDVEKYGFKHITNFIYLEKQPIKTEYKYDAFIVLSPDERLTQLNSIAQQFDALNISYKFVTVSSRKPVGLYKNIEHTSTEIKADELKEHLDNSRIILDLVRDGHNGLSFRIFEALAYQKKIITTNASVKNYAFYNPNNIMVIDSKNPKIDASFFNTPYQVLPEDIYHEFTVDNFTDTVFKLK
ncbi:hypothetical protein [Lacinutrix sp. 5H-3-7-4]|uniref:hypothetical protein n=1 Tax=Lacinutrix sp. (strain 5H-3-7-4) TaxID=983544 RepID=UPI00020A3ABB|nr:hypothetical protein [Lacinutrix sp. 5H-3-7-4]AEH00076.1 hypothetical protein Lacal_0223 [Lacinutrix sp. 5H-3-7-4]